MIKLQLTEEEIKSLLSFVDAGLRSGGLKVAETALHFQKKFEQAIQESRAPVPEEEEDD